ncbi:MAG: response regulator [Bacteroidales bacterium]|nr:response regulator [Bacteroidales bacterium]
MSDIFGRQLEKKEEDEVKVPEEVTLAKDEVQQEVAKLEKSLTDRSAQRAETESVLLKRNNDLTSRLQFLILKLEQRETESLLVKSLEAESLAQQTYRWLAIFCAAAVLFLILVLFTIINYNRKASESQRILHLAKMEAEKLVKAKELFTANVSHELRTPMNAIYGLTEQLMQQPMEPTLKEQLSVIKKSAEYLNKVVNDILDFSKIEAGKMSLENIPFSVRKILEEICMLNQVIADQKHLNFKCTYINPLPEYVMGDPTRLQQVILNLLNNAFKFTGQGEVTIEVSATYPNPSTALIEIAVSDTGIGIAPEKLSNIFDDYSQADQSTTRRYGGTGLGLSIIKRLVELMNGSISVKSIMQAGTTFTCSIPFSIANTHVPLPENEFEVINIPDELKNISVLVADDEEYNRMLLSAIFKKWGIFFRCVSNGKEVVQYAREKQYDIILMDIQMPEINGYEASREILLHRPKSGIIALTAGNYTNEIEKFKLSGMKGLLLKPFSEKELINTMLETLNKNTVPHSTRINTSLIAENNDNINLDELYRVSGGDEKFAEEMLQLFLKSTSEGITKLKQFYEAKDWNSIADTAHKMAPPCRHLGAMNLYRNLKELEKQENHPENIPEC